MTPSNASLTTSSSTIMKHTEPEGAKKSRFSPSYYDVYAGNPPQPTSGQMMMSSAYSSGPGSYHPHPHHPHHHHHPHHQTTTSNNAFHQYPNNTTSYPNYPTTPTTGNNPQQQSQQTTASVLNGPPTPQFVQSTSLGPPSPAAALTSPFSTSQFTSATPAQAAAAAAAVAAAYTHHMPSPQLSSPASHQTARTVYVGNIPSETQVSEIMDHVKVGNVDSIRPLPEKNCVFITFVDAGAAAQFYHETTTTKKLTVNGTELRVGWGRPSAIPTQIHVALQNGASRNVFLGSLDNNPATATTEEYLNEQLSRFGPIEQIKLIKDKNIAFVHFLSTSSAIKCVASLPSEKEWSSRRVYYGRDRCAPLSKISSSNSSSTTTQNTTNVSTQQGQYIQHHPHHPHHPAHHPHAHHPHHHQVFPASPSYPNTFQVRFPSTVSYDPYTGAAVETYPASPVAAANVAAAVAAAAASGNGATQTGGSALMGSIANRTIYLGNIHPDTSCEEICNVIRGGILSQIRYLSDKHIAFVTFVDPTLALHFYNQALYHGLVIKNRRLKIGWGKASALSPSVLSAVQNGGSRNVYLGNIDETITEEKLKQDFSDYGEIELVNTLKEKNCAFVNFTSIAAAARAIEGIRSKEEYKKFRINYGKDRCGNPPRIQQQQQYQGGDNRAQHQRTASTSGGSAVDPALLTPSSVTMDPKDDQQSQEVVVVEQQQQQPSTQDTVVPTVDTVNGVLESVLVPNGI
ncbi:hypothetical protein INT45_006739 [Circinella minor]|uniref:RRM domain-containing protein n=1 Tax=Circinella minor TaxID=1195481 RepID=A0A8H7S677_9FUNG|nr:hypothetical protein INT45_006739 [Circinella minor]